MSSSTGLCRKNSFVSPNMLVTQLSVVTTLPRTEPASSSGLEWAITVYKLDPTGIALNWSINSCRLHGLVAGKDIWLFLNVNLKGKTGSCDAWPSWSKVVKWDIPTFPRQYPVWQNFWAKDSRGMVSALPKIKNENKSHLWFGQCKMVRPEMTSLPDY